MTSGSGLRLAQASRRAVADAFAELGVAVAVAVAAASVLDASRARAAKGGERRRKERCRPHIMLIVQVGDTFGEHAF